MARISNRSLSSPPRIRTWTTAFEAPHAVRYTSRPCRSAFTFAGRLFTKREPTGWHALVKTRGWCVSTPHRVPSATRDDHESTPCGIRTRIPGMKDQDPEPLEERGGWKEEGYACRVSHLSDLISHIASKWGRRRSNPRLRLFRPSLDRLSYNPGRFVVLCRELRIIGEPI